MDVAENAIPKVMQNAAVDIEDKDFWTEGAIDPVRLTFCGLTRSCGGSTIPMQEAKLELGNVFARNIKKQNRRNCSRKLPNQTLDQSSISSRPIST